MSCRQIVTSLSFFQFMANLEQSGSRIPDAQHVKLIFSLVGTFNLTKTENRTKKCLTFFQFMVLKSMFSETTYVCVFMYQISSF